MARTSFALLLIALLLHAGLYAQQTRLDQLPEEPLHVARGLFSHAQYATAQQRFAQAAALPGISEAEKAECAYSIGVCALRLKNPDGVAQLQQFLEQYPSSLWALKAHLELGGYYYEKQDYKSAAAHLKYTQITRVTSHEDIERVFRLAYTYYALKDYKKARPLFAKISRGFHNYASSASYYAGHLAYMDKDYARAIEDFEVAAKDTRYKPETDVLIPSIYYKQQQYDKVSDFVKEFEASGRPMPSGLSLLAGEVYFKEKNYQSAYKYFLAHVGETQGKAERTVFYRLGYSSLKVGDKENAIRYLGKAADGDDELAQVAAYHLGLTYISANQKNAADIAFDKCRKLTHSKEIQELGAYNYVKVNYDAENFGAVVDATKFYQSTFPEGKYIEELYDLQSDALVRTGDYAKALDVISKISNKSDKVKQNLQRIAYNKGVQEYNDGRYKEAISSLMKATDYPMDADIDAFVRFWLGEINSLGGYHDQALMYYQQVPEKSAAYTGALYGLGYAHYNTRSYAKALEAFKAFIDRPGAERSQRVDALVRLGDCHYAAKNYASALGLYDAALRANFPETDYVYFQKALAEEGAGELNAALRSLDQVIVNFPTSKLLDRAYFQKGVLYFDNGRMSDAIEWLTQFIEKFPQHQQIADVYVKRGQAYSLAGSFSLAANDFRWTIDTQPTSTAADISIRSLYDMQKNGFNDPRLNEYEKKFMKANPESSVAVEAELGKALKPFNEEDFKMAIGTLNEFLRKRSKTPYAGEAYQKLAFSYAQEGRKQDAIANYKLVEGPYQVKALKEAGDLELEMELYADAVSTFLQFKRVATSRRQEEQAVEGLMKAYLGINDYEAALRYADQIINEKMTKYVNTAYLYKGKIALQQQQYSDALQYFRMTTQLAARQEQGAEAQYLIGTMFREQKKLDDSIAELIKVRSDFEGYNHWIYRAFLVLADNYLDKDNTMQAKATLQSIIDNAQDDPAAVQAAQAKLGKISG